MIIVCNHVSFIDSFVVFDMFNYCTIAKDSVKNIPLIGSIATQMGVIYIDRTNKDS